MPTPLVVAAAASSDEENTTIDHNPLINKFVDQPYP
jgi:hypothetical protein